MNLFFHQLNKVIRMQITPSPSAKGIIGVFGHAGIGHVHSHHGFVQDDSAGLAVVTHFLKKAYPANTVIESVAIDHPGKTITVHTIGGGKGAARARRGITPFEAELMQRAIGMDTQLSQRVAFRTFGRIYGQGVMESAVAMQAACALALLDTFEKNYPEKFLATPEDIPGNAGRIIGAVLDFGTTPVALMATVNATAEGLGPNEDLEGNIELGAKGKMMKMLGLNSTPGIVVESKAFISNKADELQESTFFIRANAESDNKTVASCLAEAASDLAFPHQVSDSAFPRGEHELESSTKALGMKIAHLGRELSSADKAYDKVRIVAMLAEIVSQDAGGVTFMSNTLHNKVSGAGTCPGTAAVISLLATRAHVEKWRIPLLSTSDVANYAAIIEKTVSKLETKMDVAEHESLNKVSFDEKELAFLFEHTVEK